MNQKMRAEMKITETIFRNKIKPIFAKAVFASIATVNEEGHAHVSPIGSVVVLSKDNGIYFEKFTKSIPKNIKKDDIATIMVVNTGRWFWLKSLIKGQFESPPAIRLVVKMGQLKEADVNEMTIFKRKVALFKKTTGYKQLWQDMSMVREFSIVDYKPIYLGHMTRKQFAVSE